jgi:hypothetical protein
MIAVSLKRLTYFLILSICLASVACTGKKDNAEDATEEMGTISAGPEMVLPTSLKAFSGEGFAAKPRDFSGKSYAFYDGKTSCTLMGGVTQDRYAKILKFESAKLVTLTSGCVEDTKAVPPENLRYFSYDDRYVTVSDSVGVFEAFTEAPTGTTISLWGSVGRGNENWNVIVQGTQGQDGLYRGTVFRDGPNGKEEHTFSNVYRTQGKTTFTFETGGFKVVVDKKPLADDKFRHACAVTSPLSKLKEPLLMLCRVTK